jgi:hypothetical protein
MPKTQNTLPGPVNCRLSASLAWLFPPTELTPSQRPTNRSLPETTMDQLTTQPPSQERSEDEIREILAKYLPFAIWGLCGFEPSERRAALVTLARFIVGPNFGKAHHDTQKDSAGLTGAADTHSASIV